MYRTWAYSVLELMAWDSSLLTYVNRALYFQDLKGSRMQRMQSSITDMKEKGNKNILNQTILSKIYMLFNVWKLKRTYSEIECSCCLLLQKTYRQWWIDSYCDLIFAHIKSKIFVLSIEGKFSIVEQAICNIIFQLTDFSPMTTIDIKGKSNFLATEGFNRVALKYLIVYRMKSANLPTQWLVSGKNVL